MITYLLLAAGIALLVKGADWLVDGATALSKRLGVSTLVIGLTVVAFGTSAPELVVSIMAALDGSTDVAFGNIVGSNLANILLVLGLVAAIHTIRVHHRTVVKEIPFEILSAIALLIVANDFVIDRIEVFSLTRVDGLVMILFFCMFVYYAVESARKGRKHLEEKRIEIPGHGMLKSGILFLVGLVGLYLGGKWTVDSAVAIASSLGLSQFLISSTVIAIGTSLPELVTSITALLRDDLDLAVGNVIGSNIFNVFWILGITAMISPISIPAGVNMDLGFLLLSSILLFVFMYLGKKHHLERWQGWTLLILYVAYISFTIYRG